MLRRLFVVLALAALVGPAGARSEPLRFPAAPDLIDADALPRDPAVRKAWKAAAAQQPLATFWSPEWRYDVPKRSVVKALTASYETLRRAAKDRDDPELLLALGLTARYASNVGVDGAAEAGIAALERALGADPRAGWFLGASLCQSTRVVEGWARLQEALRTAEPGSLPQAFWREYGLCAAAGSMPAHVLRSCREVAALGEETPFDEALRERAEETLAPSEAARSYRPEDAWSARVRDDEVVVTSHLCGLRFTAQRRVPLQAEPVHLGTCRVMTYVGPFRGKASTVHPGIMIHARTGGGASLAALVSRLLPAATPSPGEDLPCPAKECIWFRLRTPGGYERTGEGDGVGLVVAFERAEPELPGLALEQPLQRESPADGSAIKTSLSRWRRLPGTIQYVVVLDVAESVAPEARERFGRFLSALVVD